MLGSTRFDEEALLRAKKERKLEHEHRKKSLNGLTWYVPRPHVRAYACARPDSRHALTHAHACIIDACSHLSWLTAAVLAREALMRLATGEDPRFSQLTPAHIDAITLPQSAESLQAALRPENLEIVIVGDVEQSNAELAELLQLYLGTLAGGVPANHPSAVHWRHCMSSLSHPSRALPIADASHGKEEAGEGGGGKKVGGGKAKGRRQDPASDASGQEAKPWNLVRHATRVTLVVRYRAVLVGGFSLCCVCLAVFVLVDGMACFVCAHAHAPTRTHLRGCCSTDSLGDPRMRSRERWCTFSFAHAGSMGRRRAEGT